MRTLTVIAALLVIAPGTAAAQSLAIKEESPGLLSQAKITGDSALKLAQVRVPNSTVKSGEIEKEHDKLVYSFDLVVAGKPGIEEVLVDAVTGKIVAVEHESAEDEAKEAKKEKDKPAPYKP